MPPAHQDDDTTLRAYGALIATYGGFLTAATVALARRDRLPERLPWSDLALAAVASNVLSRRITKDRVTRVVRAPFTEPDGAGAPGEVNEVVTAPTGARRAIGELLACPFCLSQWTSTIMVLGLVVAPKPARLVASVLAVSGASDQLHYLRTIVHHAAEPTDERGDDEPDRPVRVGGNAQRGERALA
jgi:hypothetical protein